MLFDSQYESKNKFKNVPKVVKLHNNKFKTPKEKFLQLEYIYRQQLQALPES